MKAICCVALGAAIAACAAEGASARTIFEGRLVITDVENCLDSSVGERLTSLYHVANLGGNSDRTSLTAVRDLNAEGYQLIGGRFGNKFRAVDAVETGSGAHAFQAEIRITSSDPATGDLTANTNFVRITGEIRNRRDDTNGLGCTVKFRAAYTRRIEPN